MVSQKKKASQTPTSDLPAIPDKLYFPIGEVASLCELKPHVLRYWEQEFSALKPIKRRGNRRYYKRKDVEVVREIRELLYLRGFTIEGARQQLSTEIKAIKQQAAVTTTVESSRKATSSSAEQTATTSNSPMTETLSVESAVSELESLLDSLEEI